MLLSNGFIIELIVRILTEEATLAINLPTNTFALGGVKNNLREN